MSYIGSEAFGEIGILPEGVDMAVVAAVALAFYRLGISSGYRTPYLSESVIWQNHEPAGAAVPAQASDQSPSLAKY
ncbi:hypothetical protein IFT91_22940 [Pseudomonas fluorescens]|nr:hypothetical protein [Pseudomonas fluorescens]